MTTVTGYPADRLRVIEDTTIIDGSVDSDGLFTLYSRNGASIPVGNVKGEQGEQGETGGAIVAENSIFTDALQDGAVTRNKIADGSVDYTKIENNSIRHQNLADNSVQSRHITDEDVLTRHIQDGAITRAKLNENAVDGGVLSDNSVNTEHIAIDAVTSEELAADSVTAHHIISGGVGNSELGTNSVTAGKIAANAVTTEEIKNGSVTASKMADDSVSKEICVSTEWTPIVLEPGWINYAGRQPAEYREFLGEVQFRGTVRLMDEEYLPTDRHDSIVFKLQSAPHRIKLQDTFPGTGTPHSPGMYFDVQPDGYVRVYNIGFGGLDGIYTDQGPQDPDKILPIPALGLAGIRYSID